MKIKINNVEYVIRRCPCGAAPIIKYFKMRPFYKKRYRTVISCPNAISLPCHNKKCICFPAISTEYKYTAADTETEKKGIQFVVTSWNETINKIFPKVGD